MWQTSKFFKDKYIVVGDWKFDSALSFPHCKYLGADTETKLYCDGKLLSEDEAYHLYNDVNKKGVRKHNQKWIK